MSKLVGLSGMKRFDQLKSSSSLGAFQISSDSVGSFSDLKLTAEKLVKEQGSAKTYLDLANSRLTKLLENIPVLEVKLQNAYNENAKHKLKQKQDEKLLRGLESELSSTKTLRDQLTERLRLLAHRVQDGDKELSVYKENVEKQLRDENRKVASLTDEKDNLMKKFEETVRANESAIESLNSKIRELQLELRSREDMLNDMHELNEKKEKENTHLIASNNKVAENLDKAMQEIQSLVNFVKMLTVKLTDLNRQSLSFSEKVVKVESLYALCFELVQEENKLETQKHQQHFDQLNSHFLNTKSEKDALQLVNLELKNKMSEFENDKKFTMARHAEECRLAEEKVRRLESDAETLLLQKAEMRNLITTLEDTIRSLSETCRLSVIQMQDFQKKHSESETENQEKIRNLQSEIHKKEEDIDTLKLEIVKHDQVVLEFKEREKQLEDQRAETQKLLVKAQGDAKKQMDQMLESKQLQLSRHLQEISQKNDQAINDFRRKTELEKWECVNVVKEKAEKAVAYIKKKCGEKLSEFEEESEQKLMVCVALLSRIRQENDKKEEHLKSYHCEELKRVQLQAENEFREKTKLLKNQHEAELRELRAQHQEECRHLEEELNIQKNKDVPSINVTQSTIFKKADKTKTASVISIPKHNKKVTHHEYEVETSHDRTITKRRKTESRIMFQDPTKNKRGTPKTNTPRDVIMRIKGGSQENPVNIGDLFSEGSLNPCADDPYAFY